jgi:hypothetical protein
MCAINTTRVDTPYPGVRQIISQRARYQREDEIPPQEGWQEELLLVPEAERYSLVAFLMAREWSIACDILAAHPALVAPWASNFLRDLVLGGQFSAKDIKIFRAHILVLDLAQTLDIGRTRAFLRHLEG